MGKPISFPSHMYGLLIYFSPTELAKLVKVLEGLEAAKAYQRRVGSHRIRAKLVVGLAREATKPSRERFTKIITFYYIILFHDQSLIGHQGDKGHFAGVG